MKYLTTLVVVPALCGSMALGSTARSTLESVVQRREVQLAPPEIEYHLPTLTQTVYETVLDAQRWEQKDEKYTKILKGDKHLITLLDTYMRAHFVINAKTGYDELSRNTGLLLCYVLQEQAKQPQHKRQGRLPRLSEDVRKRITGMEYRQLHHELRRMEHDMQRKDPLLHNLLTGASQASPAEELGIPMTKEVEASINTSYVVQQLYGALQEAGATTVGK